MKDTPEYLVTNRARGEMISHAATRIHVRHLPPVVSDEPPLEAGQTWGRRHWN